MLAAGSVALCFAAAAAAPALGSAKKGTQGRVVAAQLRGVNLTPNQDWPSPHGVSDAQADAEVKTACQLGAGVVRTFAKWYLLEPSFARFDEAYAKRIDQVLSTASGCGTRVIVNLTVTPCWATAENLRSRCIGTASLDPPADPAFYGEAVERMLRRWPSIYAIEVWNEPNVDSFFWGSAPEYAAMVNAAGAAADRAGSSAQVLAGVIALADSRYLQALYAAGMTNYDALALHPYDFRVNGAHPGYAKPSSWRTGRDYFETGIRAIRRTMVSAGEGAKGLWLTEFGYSVCPTQPHCVSEARQARGLADSFRAAARMPFVKGLMAFSLRDIGEDGNRWDNRFGLLRRDFSPRPAYWAVGRVLRELARGARPLRKSRARRRHG